MTKRVLVHRLPMRAPGDMLQQARGFVASRIGHVEIYVSGGAEYQGPDGGGPVAVIATLDAPLIGGTA